LTEWHLIYLKTDSLSGNIRWHNFRHILCKESFYCQKFKIMLLKYYNKPFSLDLFESIFNDELFKPSITPEYDIVEDDEQFGLEFMLPGFKKEDVSIDVDDRVLTVKGERTAQEETIFNRKGSFYGKFEKSFTLPEEVLADEISASFEDGILTLEIPKDVEKKLSKTIEIK